MQHQKACGNASKNIKAQVKNAKCETMTEIWYVRNKTLGQHASQNVKSTHQNASKNIKMLVGTSKHESKSKQRIIFQMHFSTLQLLQNRY